MKNGRGDRFLKWKNFSLLIQQFEILPFSKSVFLSINDTI